MGERSAPHPLASTVMNTKRGRPPVDPSRAGAPGTRERILLAARRRLLSRGYTGTTLRAVAADAGVDASLISYYFGSKQGLFSAVMRLTLSPPQVLTSALAGDPARLPERLLAALTAAWEDPDSGPALRALVVMALEEPAVLRAVVEFFEQEVIARLAEQIGGRRATARAGAAVSTLAGVVFTRYVLRLQPSAGMSREQLIHDLAPALRASLAGPTSPRPR
ncbi:TetR family transcriptional regulator [Kineococcus aurantiacus]|uniref:TetR/AcrR family transcriptional regulator n=2 Tax=Kineococcus aurantiacus TaxID=37633 RepID=UPI003CCDAAF3